MHNIQHPSASSYHLCKRSGDKQEHVQCQEKVALVSIGDLFKWRLYKVCNCSWGICNPCVSQKDCSTLHSIVQLHCCVENSSVTALKIYWIKHSATIWDKARNRGEKTTKNPVYKMWNQCIYSHHSAAHWLCGHVRKPACQAGRSTGASIYDSPLHWSFSGCCGQPLLLTYQEVHGFWILSFPSSPCTNAVKEHTKVRIRKGL